MTIKQLILIKGLPGSGKSFLAKQLLEESIESGLTCSIHSTDSFFIEDGHYKFDPTKLGLYHRKNIEDARLHMELSIDRVIIDNTNISLKEVEPYVEIGLNNGYEIHFKEPATSWHKDIDELVRRNQHRVPRESIERMMKRWESTESIIEKLCQKYNCCSCMSSQKTWNSIEKTFSHVDITYFIAKKN